MGQFGLAGSVCSGPGERASEGETVPLTASRTEMFEANRVIKSVSGQSGDVQEFSSAVASKPSLSYQFLWLWLPPPSPYRPHFCSNERRFVSVTRASTLRVAYLEETQPVTPAVCAPQVTPTHCNTRVRVATTRWRRAWLLTRVGTTVVGSVVTGAAPPDAGPLVGQNLSALQQVGQHHAVVVEVVGVCGGSGERAGVSLYLPSVAAMYWATLWVTRRASRKAATRE